MAAFMGGLTAGILCAAVVIGWGRIRQAAERAAWRQWWEARA